MSLRIEREILCYLRYFESRNVKKIEEFIRNSIYSIVRYNIMYNIISINSENHLIYHFKSTVVIDVLITASQQLKIWFTSVTYNLLRDNKEFVGLINIVHITMRYSVI